MKSPSCMMVGLLMAICVIGCKKNGPFTGEPLFGNIYSSTSFTQFKASSLSDSQSWRVTWKSPDSETNVPVEFHIEADPFMLHGESGRLGAFFFRDRLVQIRFWPKNAISFQKSLSTEESVFLKEVGSIEFRLKGNIQIARDRSDGSFGWRDIRFDDELVAYASP